MQPFDPIEYMSLVQDIRREQAIEEALVTITDDSLREQGYKEPYPGYFENDPRYPGYGVHDRYLMDHPGPDWRTKQSLAPEDNRLTTLKRTSRETLHQPWDEELIAGPPARVLSTPETSYYPTPDAKTVYPAQESDTKKYSGVWICQDCGKQYALWPTVRTLDLKGRRPFWHKIIDLWERDWLWWFTRILRCYTYKIQQWIRRAL